MEHPDGLGCTWLVHELFGPYIWKLISERFLNQFGDQNNEATIASGFTYRPSSSYDGTEDTCDWIFTHSNIEYKVFTIQVSSSDELILEHFRIL